MSKFWSWLGGLIFDRLLSALKEWAEKLFAKEEKKKSDEKKIDQTMDTYEARVEEIKASTTMTEEEKNEALIAAHRDRD